MCLMCQMQLLDDHQRRDGKACAQCGVFQTDDGSQCYHCFSKASSLEEECPVCAPEIPDVFLEEGLEEELATIKKLRTPQ